MMAHVYEGNNANDLWLAALADVNKVQIPQDGRDQPTKEILNAFFILHDPRQRFVFSRPIDPAFAMAEVIWMLSGSRDLGAIAAWNSRMRNYSDNGSTLHGAYGHRIRRHFGFDQLHKAYLALRHNPNSRQVIIQIYDTVHDFPSSHGEPVSKDIPCNLMIHALVREEKLHFTVMQRSNDLIWGTPYNFIQFTSIQEVLAGLLGIDVGDHVRVADSLHIYQRHWEHAQQAEHNVMFHTVNTDDLRLTVNEYEQVLYDMRSAMIHLLGVQEYNSARRLIESTPVPGAYTNILWLLAAEVMRRRDSLGYAGECLAECSNMAYIKLFTQWVAEKERQHADIA